VTEVEKYTLDDANTFTFMKRKREGHTHEWCHHDYYNLMLRSLPNTPICKILRISSRKLAKPSLSQHAYCYSWKIATKFCREVFGYLFRCKAL